jgi:RNA polymerase sporulation-specific sigma factor
MTLEEVFNQYERLLHKLSCKWDRLYEHDELFQTASIGLIKAYNSYDINKGYSFSTYLGRVVNNEILMFNRRSRKYINMESTEKVVCIDKDNNELVLMDLLADETNYEGLVLDSVDKEKLPLKIRTLLNSLDKREKDIITCIFFQGLKQQEVSKKLGLAQSYVSRIMQRGLKKMKDNYEQ